ncbi:hypothetical protein RDI58_028339 [Solanum bulbocastanum]|uniref:DUF4218 domain-containing protein n=1 Tax=Solanum bulbocastanum TaxID=147425 RepID=A0AAN8STP0_SOLBU
MTVLFDRKVEMSVAPIPLTGDETLIPLQNLERVSFGKGKKRKRNVSTKAYNWRKKSIFFQLPYWKSLRLRHNLDMMHIERNVSDNILSTVMSIVGKTKDTLKSIYDLVDLVSDAFSSNISRCVNALEKKIHGLKSHDHHVLLQYILPIAIRGLLPKDVCEPIIALGKFFKNLYSKYLRTFKSYIRNPAHQEGAIAGGDVANENIIFFSHYFKSISTKFNKPTRNDDGFESNAKI